MEKTKQNTVLNLCNLSKEEMLIIKQKSGLGLDRHFQFPFLIFVNNEYTKCNSDYLSDADFVEEIEYRIIPFHEFCKIHFS